LRARLRGLPPPHQFQIMLFDLVLIGQVLGTCHPEWKPQPERRIAR
jgi:hypothetical protein